MFCTLLFCCRSLSDTLGLNLRLNLLGQIFVPFRLFEIFGLASRQQVRAFAVAVVCGRIERRTVCDVGHKALCIERAFCLFLVRFCQFFVFMRVVALFASANTKRGRFCIFYKQMTLNKAGDSKTCFLCLQSPFPLLCRTSPMFSGGGARMTLDGATALHCCRSV